jgi:hypothetical protein
MSARLQNTRRPMHLRLGSMLVEAVVAAALLAVLLGVSLRVLGAVGGERRAIEKRAIALQEAAGAMERARALAWNEITPERLQSIGLSPSAAQILTGAAMRWTVEPAATGPPARHLRLQITWQNPSGGPSPPLQLDSWAYAPLSSQAPPGDSP